MRIKKICENNTSMNTRSIVCNTNEKYIYNYSYNWMHTLVQILVQLYVLQMIYLYEVFYSSSHQIIINYIHRIRSMLLS